MQIRSYHVVPMVPLNSFFYNQILFLISKYFSFFLGGIVQIPPNLHAQTVPFDPCYAVMITPHCHYVTLRNVSTAHQNQDLLFALCD